MLTLKYLRQHHAPPATISRFCITVSDGQLPVAHWPVEQMINDPFDDQSLNTNTVLQRCDLIWLIGTLQQLPVEFWRELGLQLIRMLTPLPDIKHPALNELIACYANATGNLLWCLTANRLGSPACTFVAEIYRQSALSATWAQDASLLKALDRQVINALSNLNLSVEALKKDE